MSFPITLTAKQYRERAKTGWITRRANGNVPQRKHKSDGSFKVSKRGKYNQDGRRVNGIHCDSKAEADRYEQLLEMEKAGTIDQLEVHPTYTCMVNGQHICTYEADFRYRIKPGRLGQRTLVEDVKGLLTKDYKIKRALVHALNLCEIIELPVPKHGVGRYRWLTADQFHTAPEET